MVRRIANFVSKDVPPEPDFSIATTELDELTAKTQEILRREITNLMIESTAKKLSPTSSAALVSYIKLLGELKDKETEALKAMGDEHLKKLARDQS